MKQAHDFTQWHTFVENARVVINALDVVPDSDEFKNPLMNRSAVVFKENIEKIENIAKLPFFILPDLELTPETYVDVHNSFQTIIQHVGLNLPFSSMVIETEIYKNIRGFFILDEDNDYIHFTLVSLNGRKLPLCAFIGFRMQKDKNLPPVAYDYEAVADAYKDEVAVEAICRLSLGRLIVLLNTRGIEQERVEAAPALNRSRYRKDKPLIPGVTVIKIGHYYDRDGTKHEFGRNSPRVHWRRGHTRGVWVGPRGDQRLEQRYIFPCLVNYEPGTEQPPQQLRVLQ